jgi:hypothetical protein
MLQLSEKLEISELKEYISTLKNDRIQRGLGIPGFEFSNEAMIVLLDDQVK